MSEPLDQETLEFAHRMFDLAREGHTTELMSNVEAGLPINLTNDKGDTLLILAAYHDKTETVGALLDAGADHTRTNDRGQTALASSVFRKGDDAIRLFLDAGANPALGSPSAVEVARFFDLPEQLALLEK